MVTYFHLTLSCAFHQNRDKDSSSLVFTSGYHYYLRSITSFLMFPVSCPWMRVEIWTARLIYKGCCLRAGLICLNMSSSSAVSVFFVVGMFKWWYDLSDATKAAVIGGPLLVICILVIYCCCCRSRPANQGAVLVTPAVGPTAVMATSTNTTAPMRPLVNVA